MHTTCVVFGIVSCSFSSSLMSSPRSELALRLTREPRPPTALEHRNPARGRARGSGLAIRSAKAEAEASISLALAEVVRLSTVSRQICSWHFTEKPKLDPIANRPGCPYARSQLLLFPGNSPARAFSQRFSRLPSDRSDPSSVRESGPASSKREREIGPRSQPPSPVCSLVCSLARGLPTGTVLGQERRRSAILQLGRVAPGSRRSV